MYRHVSLEVHILSLYLILILYHPFTGKRNTEGQFTSRFNTARWHLANLAIHNLDLDLLFHTIPMLIDEIHIRFDGK